MMGLRMAGLGLVVAVLLTGCAPKPEFTATGEVVSGMKGLSPTVQLDQPAPDFEINDQFGKAWKLSDYRGKVVLIDFWAYW